MTYWVFFVQPSWGPGDLARAWEALSPRAQERRLLHGMTVSPGDIPPPEEWVDSLRALGCRVRVVSRWLKAASVEATPEVLERVKELSFVREIRPVAVGRRPLPKVKPVLPPKDPGDYGGAWWQENMMGVPEVHQLGYLGQGMIIGFLDTGFRLSHPALAGADIIATWDFINGDSTVENEPGDPEGQDYHGTICFATLAANFPGQMIGIAPSASYALAKTERVDTEIIAEEDYYVAGLEWLEGLGAQVVSSSLGYIDWYDYSDLDGNTAITTVAVDSAARRGVLVVTAMGNYGPFYGSLIAPADADSDIAVGAVDSFGAVAEWSSRGPTYDGRTKPELSAMGAETYTVDPYSSGYITASGTSLATPLVAGAAALLWQAKPDLTNMEIRELLMSTASNAGSPNNDIGWGIPNLPLALGLAETPTPGPGARARYDLLGRKTKPKAWQTQIQEGRPLLRLDP